jgi:hypothetical protein
MTPPPAGLLLSPAPAFGFGMGGMGAAASPPPPAPSETARRILEALDQLAGVAGGGPRCAQRRRRRCSAMHNEASSTKRYHKLCIHALLRGKALRACVTTAVRDINDGERDVLEVRAGRRGVSPCPSVNDDQVWRLHNRGRGKTLKKRASERCPLLHVAAHRLQLRSLPGALRSHAVRCMIVCPSNAAALTSAAVSPEPPPSAPLAAVRARAWAGPRGRVSARRARAARRPPPAQAAAGRCRPRAQAARCAAAAAPGAARGLLGALACAPRLRRSLRGRAARVSASAPRLRARGGAHRRRRVPDRSMWEAAARRTVESARGAARAAAAAGGAGRRGACLRAQEGSASR